MIATILITALAFAWLLYETDWMRVRLPVGIIPAPLELERITWAVCTSRFGFIKFSCGIKEPLCGWDWLVENTHPIPQVIVDFASGGVRYHWHIKDCNILKSAITATHAKPKLNRYRRNVRNG